MTKEPHPLEIPSFLRISAEERKKAWEEHPPHTRINRMIENDTILIRLKDEYNVLGNELLNLGGSFRPRGTPFQTEAEAEVYLEKVRSTIKAVKQGHATMQSQSADPKGLIKETTVETATHTNGAKKKTAPAKKTAAKKTAPKKAKKAKSATGRFDPDAKITIIVKENPRRAGSDKFKQFEKAQKATTVADYVKSGGELGPLHHSVKQGWIKVSS